MFKVQSVRTPIVGVWRQFSTPLHLLIAAQTVFLAIGIEFLSFSITWPSVLAALGSASAAELILSNRHYFLGKTKSFKFFIPLTAIAAALGIALFFRAIDFWYFALAGALAVASKYVLLIDGKHFFNPSNFAITYLAFVLPFAVTIELTHWGNNPYLFALIAAVCLYVSYRAGAIGTTLSFLAAYTAILLPLVYLDPDMHAAHHLGLLGPSLMLFASFMITDPKTAPIGGMSGILHGAGVACMYFVLEILGIRYALFVSSFLVAALNAAFRALRVVPSIKNIPSTLFAGALMLGAGGFLAVQDTPRLPLTSIAPSFILLGVESDGLHRCEEKVVLRRTSESSIEAAGYTYGASWGDYDGDGYEDIFISNLLGSKSRLLRNNGDNTFMDTTESAGLPPINSSSALFIDYDADGDLDLLVARTETEPGSVFSSPRLFQNNNGRFTDVSHAYGLEQERFLGAGYLSAADYDGDAILDFVMVSNGTFLNPPLPHLRAFERARRDPFYLSRRDVHVTCTEEGLSALLREHPYAFSDTQRTYILDKLLPMAKHPCLFYSSYINLWHEDSVGSSLAPRILTRTLIIPGSAHLYRGTGTSFKSVPSFADLMDTIVDTYVHGRVLTNKSSIHVSGRYFQPVSFDYNNDSLQDIFLAVDFGRNVLLKNHGDFVFTDESLASGFDFHGSGMGADVGDWNNDGLPDIVVSNVVHDYLFENQGDGTFVNRYAELNLSVNEIGWGIALFDYDLDGWQDLYTVNGITSEYEPDLDMRRGLTRPMFRTDTLYRNTGNRTLTEVTGTAMCPQSANGKALAVADYDRDGDPDLFVGTVQTGNKLLINTLQPEHFLAIELSQSNGARTAVGAKVHVSTASGEQTRWLLAGQSFASQGGSALLFSLPGENPAAQVRVVWPSGKESTHAFERGGYVRIKEPF